MIHNFSTALGNLISHFYRNHQIALTQPEIWLINNILACSDTMFESFEMISDIIGIAMTSTDHAALINYFEQLLQQAKLNDIINVTQTPCLN